MSGKSPKRSFILRFLDHTNLVVTGLTALTILYTRSAGVLYFTTGALFTSGVAKVAKRFVRQPRPTHPLPGRQKHTYGMPSTHSATITFYAVYTLLAARYLPIHHSFPSNIRTLGPWIVVPWAATIAVSRIWLGHHTWPQVGAGSLVGCLVGVAWFTAWIQGLNVYGRTVEETFLVPLQQLY
ncbi:PAP2-domain-containing protein [Irpex rosettiformis]|uniref:PAP2-domain-containing protein n=1 Tax=Irpex rosettiformis TaxID=378272 RepID=A0ACB8UJE0_9APHY|nr:PAP2-domain-containing protein [Irpex rosettiformis]